MERRRSADDDPVRPMRPHADKAADDALLLAATMKELSLSNNSNSSSSSSSEKTRTTSEQSSCSSTSSRSKEQDEMTLLREAEALPQMFTVKYLGKREARGLWGIKHTRGPVDDMVVTARALKPGSFLPFLQLHVAPDGVTISEMPQNQNKNFEGGNYPIDMISYGVQDLVYTRVFAMIVVRSISGGVGVGSSAAGVGVGGGGGERPAGGDRSLLECHAFVCDGRQNARRLTFALATAFRLFSQKVKSRRQQQLPKPFAIDLRSPEEIQADLKGGDVLDSEA